MQLIIRAWQTLNKIGIIDDPINIIWNNKYFTAGEFEFETLKTDETLKILKINNFVTRPDVDGEICIIETVTYTKNEENENVIKVQGLFAQSLLGRRVVWDNVLVNGNTITQLRALIDANAIGEIASINEDRVICSGKTIQGMTGATITTPAKSVAQLVSISGNTIIQSMIGDLPNEIAVAGNVQLTADDAVYSFGGLYKNPYTNRIDTVELKGDTYVKKQRVMYIPELRDWLIATIKNTTPEIIDENEIALGITISGMLDTEPMSTISDESIFTDSGKLIFRHLQTVNPPPAAYGDTSWNNDVIVKIDALGINRRVHYKQAALYLYLGLPASVTYIKLTIETKYRTETRYVPTQVWIPNVGYQTVMEMEYVQVPYQSSYEEYKTETYSAKGNPYLAKKMILDVTEKEVKTRYTINSIQNNSSTYTLTDGNATTIASMLMNMETTDISNPYLKLEPTAPTESATLYQILKGDNLQEFVETTLQSIGYGLGALHSGEYVYLQFKKGVDRTRNQTTHKQIVFTRALDNLLGYEISHSASGKYNVARCCGKNDNDVEVYTAAGAGAGITRRETFVDVSDIGTYGTADYTQALQAKGELELNGFTLVIDATIDAEVYKYRQDYNLGDLVTIVIDDFSLAYNVRVLEVCETYDDNGYGITLVLGQ